MEWIPRSMLLQFLTSIVILIGREDLYCSDDSSDWRRWSGTSVKPAEIDVLNMRMGSIGLRPLLRDPRIFQPAQGGILRLEALPEGVAPYGLSLTTFNTSEEQLSRLNANMGLYSLEMHGFRDRESCLRAVKPQVNLRFLSVMECAVDDEFVCQLLNMRNLETLDLRKTEVNGSGLAKLNLLPRLQSLQIDMSAEQFEVLIDNQLVHLLPIAHGSDRIFATKDCDITELEMNGFYGYPVSNGMLKNLGRLKSLRKLSLIESKANNDAIPQLVEIPQLQSLDLERTLIDNEALRLLATAPHLRSLCLDETNISVDGLMHLTNMKTLQELHLNRCKIDDSSLSALGMLASLERLELSGTQVRFQNGIRSGSFKTLEYLNVRGSSVTDLGLSHVAKLPKLRRLDLTLCAVGDDGIKSLSTARALEDLNLNCTSITDEALRYAASSETLQVLSLQGTTITDEGLLHLLGMKNLKSLVLYGTQTTSTAVRRLQLELPHCEIVR